MATVGQLVDQGIRAYVEGRLEDARRLLEEALQREPANARARSYLILLHGGSPRPRAPARPAAAPTQAAAPPAAPPPPAAAEPAATHLEEHDLEPDPFAPVPPAADEPLPDVPPAGARPAAPAAPRALADDGFAPSPWDDGPAVTATIVLEAEGGMDLAAVAEKSDLRPLVPEAAPREPPPAPGTPGAPPPSSGRREVDAWMSAAKDLLALDDFSGSLEMIERILKIDPEHPEARAYLRQNEAALVDMYESKLGPLGRIPRLAIKPEEVMWLNLDHRAGFLLSQIDGTVDFESLFALSGLPRLDTARILATLIADGVITA